MKITHSLAVTSAVTLALAGCASAPPQQDTIASAREAITEVENSPDAGKYAAAEISAAHQALREAERLSEGRKSRKQIEQAAYVAQRHADIAAEHIAKGQAEARAAAAEQERQRVLLQAREAEAARAREQAEADRLQAQTERQQAESERARADAERQQAQLAADAAMRQAADLATQLRDLQAKQTDRGLVLTLGDVLFDSGRATLKPGAASTIDRLSAFLERSPDRSVAIEGHTDSVGTDEYNLGLSDSRANAVKAALVAKGVPGERVTAIGKGEGEPVAGNDNAAGRQQNRRVEIIIANPPAVAQQ